MLVEIGSGRDRAGNGRPRRLHGRCPRLLAVRMVSTEDRAGGLRGCRGPLGGWSVRHSADLEGEANRTRLRNFSGSRSLEEGYQRGTSLKCRKRVRLMGDGAVKGCGRVNRGFSQLVKAVTSKMATRGSRWVE